jgi:aspartyl-tRNA(Asn)/glutamyl-tRNA(Gln) amidotransferase subunit A
MYRVAAAFEAARNAADGGPLIQRSNGLEATV